MCDYCMCVFFLSSCKTISLLITQCNMMSARPGSSAFLFHQAIAGLESVTFKHTSPPPLSPDTKACCPLRKFMRWSCAWGSVSHSAEPPGSNAKCDLWDDPLLENTIFLHIGVSFQYKITCTNNQLFGVTDTSMKNTFLCLPVSHYWRITATAELLTVLLCDLNKFDCSFWALSVCLFGGTGTAGWLQTTPRPHALWAGQQAPTAVAHSR